MCTVHCVMQAQSMVCIPCHILSLSYTSVQAHLALNFAAGAGAAELPALSALLARAGAAWRDVRLEGEEAAAAARAQAAAALVDAGVEHQVWHHHQLTHTKWVGWWLGCGTIMTLSHEQ